MQRARSLRLVAFVEGTMEKIFINTNFSYVHLIKLNNGSSWTVNMMRTQIITNYRVLNFRPDFIIVWFDREQISDSSVQISEDIRMAIAEEGYPNDCIAVLVADRMSENIMLSDESVIRSEFNDDEYKYPGDASHGKAILKEKYRRSGENYKETFHGVRLLKKIRLSRCSVKSIFVREFYQRLSMDCWWK